jgi:hypothetical protein
MSVRDQSFESAFTAWSHSFGENWTSGGAAAAADADADANVAADEHNRMRLTKVVVTKPAGSLRSKLRCTDLISAT